MPNLPYDRGGGTAIPVGTGGTYPVAQEEVTAPNPDFGGGGNLIFVGGAGT